MYSLRGNFSTKFYLSLKMTHQNANVLVFTNCVLVKVISQWRTFIAEMCVYVWVSQKYDKVMNKRFFKHKNVTIRIKFNRRRGMKWVLWGK